MNTSKSILSAAQELFFKKGIRRVTVDEIASKLKISKKTIYQHFEDKDEIVFQFLKYSLNKRKKEIKEIIQAANNVVEGTFSVVTYVSEMLSHINPVLFEEMQIYYPKAWNYFEKFKKKFVIEIIMKELEKGQRQGLIRKNINIKLMAHLRLLQIDLLFQTDILKEFDMTVTELKKQLTLHFLYGICTEKGMNILRKYE